MNIIFARHAGMCRGVKRALWLTEQALHTAEKQNIPLICFGSIVHNRSVVEKLAADGLRTIEHYDDLMQVLEADGKSDAVIIRAHGISPEKQNHIAEHTCHLIDATCPYVLYVQQLVRTKTQNGYNILLIGDRNHPEVQGIIGYALKEAIDVIGSEEEAELFEPRQNEIYLILCQTTIDKSTACIIRDILSQRIGTVDFLNTICNETANRQEAAAEIAANCDGVVVIGDPCSSNTRKLFEKCGKKNKNVYMIENANELQAGWFKDKITIGVTAGASTPEWIIEEVKFKMEEFVGNVAEQAEVKEDETQSAEEMMNQEYLAIYDESFKDIKSGDFVKGTIVKISEDGVLVDIGYKSEGKVKASEFDNIDEIKIGDELNVYVVTTESREGELILSKRKADGEKKWIEIAKAAEDKTIVSGKVTGVVKGGLLVDIGVRAFMPGSLAYRKFVSDLEEFVGKTVDVEIIEFNRERNKVVVSAKAASEKIYMAQKDEAWAKLEVGQVIKGIVKRLVDFGAFVEIVGVEGLLHVSEISWNRISKPSDILSEGQEIEVKILALDKEKERISLGMRQLMPQPWDLAKEKFSAGDIVDGKVVSVVPFGAFVSISQGIEGLVHISQLADQFVEKPELIVKVGDAVKVRILDIDVEKKRVSLSMKSEKPAEKIETPDETPAEVIHETASTEETPAAAE